MLPPLLAITALLLGSAFLLAAGGLHGLLLPLRGTFEGFSTTELGLVGTGWAAGFMVGCLVLPALVRRIGHVRAYGALASVAAVTILLNLLIISPAAWIALRALSGFCYAGAAMIVESWINERVTHRTRGTTFAIYQTVNFTASTGGQLLLVLHPPTDHVYFVLGAIFYCLAILPTALSTAAAPAQLKTVRIELRRLYATSPVAAVGCVLIGLVNGAFGTLGAVYAQRIGLATSGIALLMAGAVLGGALMQFPVGRFSDRSDRRRVLVAVAASSALISLLIAVLQPHDATVVTVLVVAFGAVTYPMYALTVAHANDSASGDDFVIIAGGLLLLYGFGTMVGPIAAAFAMERFAPEGLFAFTAAIDAALIGYTLFRMSQRAPRPTREPFRAMSLPRNVTPESAVLDPRSEQAPVEVAEVVEAEG